MGNFKRLSSLLLTFVLLACLCPVAFAAESSQLNLTHPQYLAQDMSVSINGEIIANGKHIDAPAPYIRGSEGNVMIPLRAVAEQLGMAVIWDGAEKKVQIGDDICIWIGKDYYTKGDSTPITFGPPPEITDNFTFVSLPFFRFVLTNCSFHIQDGVIYIDSNAGDVVRNTTVTVSTPQELVDAIAPDTLITIKAGVYDLSTVTATTSNFASVGSQTEAVLVSGIKGLTLKAESGANVEFVTPDMFSEVLKFVDCKDISLSGIKAGHTVTGEYECDAGVVWFEQSSNITVDNCMLYGCGAIGIRLWNCTSARISDTTITDCSLRAVDISRSNNIVFTGCDFTDNRAYGCVIYGNGSSVEFIDCEISGNKSLLWGVVEFDGQVLFERCVFRDNALIEGSEPVFKGSEISLRDCEVEKNNFSAYWNYGVIDLGGNLLK